MQIAIYPNADGTLSILYPSAKYHSIQACCERFVPTGVKFKLIENTDLPDSEFRDAWQYPEIETDFDGVGA